MNLSVIIGRLTRDPELRTLQGGQPGIGLYDH
jgi:single-stranded DNA-binding protein